MSWTIFNSSLRKHSKWRKVFSWLYICFLFVYFSDGVFLCISRWPWTSDHPSLSSFVLGFRNVPNYVELFFLLPLSKYHTTKKTLCKELLQKSQNITSLLPLLVTKWLKVYLCSYLLDMPWTKENKGILSVCNLNNDGFWKQGIVFMLSGELSLTLL